MLELPTGTATGCSYTMRITARTENTPVPPHSRSLNVQISMMRSGHHNVSTYSLCVTSLHAKLECRPWTMVGLMAMRAVRSRYAPCFQQASSPKRLVTEEMAAERYHRRVLRSPRRSISLSVETKRLCGRGVQTKALRKVIPLQSTEVIHALATAMCITASRVSLLGRGHLVPCVTPEQRSRRLYV